MGATQAESSRQTRTDSHTTGQVMAAPPIFCRLGDSLSQTDGGHGADSIKLSASSHRAIFWNPSTQKKKMCATAAPARDADGGAEAREAARRDETRRGETRWCKRCRQAGRQTDRPPA